MKKKLLRGGLLCLPLILGTVGLCAAGESFLNAVFLSICMYGMNYQDVPPNLLVEIARWTAIVATVSGILLLFSHLWESLQNFLKYHHGDSVAVYGPEKMRSEALAQLGPCGVEGKDPQRFMQAQRYLLLDEEAVNFSFYYRNRAALQDRPVYLRCSSLPAQSAASPNLHLFSPEENAAKLFWKQQCLYSTSRNCGHRMKIVFLGFGKLGEQLLLQALQDNLFAPDQKIEYHIFGQENGFMAVHTELGRIQDPVLFEKEPWYANLPLLEQAQMVLVLEQEQQLTLVGQLLATLTREKIHVFCAGPELELLAGHERLVPFDWKAEGQRVQDIFHETLFERAKRINLRYASLYNGVPETEEQKEIQWQGLDTFTRYSNISAADYHEIRLQMLAELRQTPEALSPDTMELLSELEHMRWCRYHYLNNWRYGVPENGKNKDVRKRIHKDLVPYSTLSEEEKKKDRDNVELLLAVP